MKEEEFFEAIFNATGSGIVLVDKTGSIIKINPCAKKLLGYTEKQLSGKNINSIIPGVLPLEKPIKKTLSQKTVEAKRKDGSSLTVKVNFNTIGEKNDPFFILDLIITGNEEVDVLKEKLIFNENRFRKLVENNYDIISLLDENHRVIYRSPSATRIMGYSTDEMKTLEGSDNVHPEDKELAANKIRKAKENPGKPIHLIFRRQHKNGNYIWLEGIITNLLHDDTIKAYVTNFRDVTERKNTEEEIKRLNENLEKKVEERTHELEKIIIELTENEEKFQKVFQSSAAGITITRLSDSVYTDVNDTFAEMIGFSKKELIGSSSEKLGIVTNVTRREEILEEIRRVGFARNFEMTVLNKSGNVIDILAAVETIVLKGEKYALNVIYDITDRKRIEEQLLSVNKEMEAFSYSVSHDLRAPLRAINGYSQILIEEFAPKLGEEGARLIEIIKYNATKMGKLIDDLLAFSRLGRKEIQKNEIELNMLVEGVMIELNKSITYKAKIKIAELPKVFADYALLNQAVINLVANAIKYSSNKEKPIVEIYTEELNGETVFVVKDNGAGFDMKYANKLFGVFQRLHSQEEFEGTGVGLAIVQRVISKHGGKVWAEGEVDKGATFKFTLPKN